MPLLTVISGAADTGKSLVQEGIMALKPKYRLLARDQVRAFHQKRKPDVPIDEPLLTDVIMRSVEKLLDAGHDVLTVGQNLHPHDREKFEAIAQRTRSTLRWIHCEQK